MVVGTLAFLVAAGIDYHKFARWSYLLYGVGLILLIVVLIVGKTSRGSQRWIPLGPLMVQPSEFIKIPLMLTLASYYGATNREGWLRRLIIPGLIVLPGFLLILKQPDLGSSLGFLSIFLVIVLTVGMKSKAFGFVVLAALMLFPFVWGGVWGSLHGYQQDRILSFVDPGSDPGGGKAITDYSLVLPLARGNCWERDYMAARKRSLNSCPKVIPTLFLQYLPRNGGLLDRSFFYRCMSFYC
jgi:rod shape determining protein RodA